MDGAPLKTNAATNPLSRRLSRREIYVASILLLLGTIYLVLFVQTVISIHSTSVTNQDNNISINKSELYSDIKTILIIACSFTGSAGLLTLKKYGWFFSNAIIVILVVILAAGWIQLARYGFTAVELILIILASVVVLTALIILQVPITRNRFMIKRKDYGWQIALTAILAAIFFGLQ